FPYTTLFRSSSEGQIVIGNVDRLAVIGKGIVGGATVLTHAAGVVITLIKPGTAAAITATVQKADIVPDHFGNANSSPFVIFETSYLQPSLNGDQPPFLHIVGDRFRKLSPDNDIDKVGLPLPPLVGERTTHRQSKAGDGDTIGGVTKLGIPGQAADQYHPI